ncbi:MAG: pyridoxamine 5'-phosphate oxidase family protein [Cellulosilyticaceae bacterium]
MITKNEFARLMNTQCEMALSTSVNNQPNVRIVNFYFDNTTDTLYFTTFGDNDKVKEFETNPRVAFTTIPHGGTEHIKASGLVKQSTLTLSDVADGFIRKIPGYKDTLEQAYEYLILFEIAFDQATVTLDFENTDVILLGK